MPACVVVGFLGLLALLLCAPVKVARADSRPNVLLIVTDDQRLDGTMAVMPKTREWFKTGGEVTSGDPFAGGTEYTDSVSTTPLCCPSRTSIFTGQYPHTHGTRQNDSGVNFDANWPGRSLQAYLKGAGYRTGIVGEYFPAWPGFDSAAPPPFWDDWSLTANSGYSGVEVNENGMRKWVWRYESDYLGDRADQFLDSAADQPGDPPWLLYVAPRAPHGPHRPAPKYEDAAVPALNDANPAYFEKDRRDKPRWVATARNDSDTFKRQWKAYLRTLPSVDDMVDRVMRKLHGFDDGAEERNTIAIFTSDNGYMFGEHGLDIKEKPYLESIQVPFYLRWPDGNVLRDYRDDLHMVGNVDIAPTLLDAINRSQPGDADIAPVEPMEGVPLLNPFQIVRSRMLTEHCGVGPGISADGRDFAPGAPLSWAAIHTHAFHYIEHYKTGGDSTEGCLTGPRKTDFSNIRYREYYDLVNDHEETRNLLADDDPDNDPPVDALQTELQKDRTCAGAACVPRVTRPLEVPVDVQITSGPDDVSGDRSPTFKFTSDRPALGTQCRWARRTELADAPWTNCQSPFTITSGIAAAHDYGFSVRQIGELNTDSDDYFWTSEQAPDTAITDQPAKLASTTSATFQFTATPNGSSFRCSIDGQPETACDSGTIDYDGLAEGPHVFEVYAIASFGTEAMSADYHWSIDSIAPDTQPIQPVATASPHSSSVSFAITCAPSAGPPVPPCSDGSDARDVQFECRLYEGTALAPSPPPFEACGEPGANLGLGANREVEKTYMGLAHDTTYTFEARTIDPSGNAGPVRSLEWTTSSSQSFATAPDASWPEITAGYQVKAIVPDGSGGFYVGGDFTRAGTASQDFARTDLLHVTGSGTVDPNWDPTTDTGAVNAMVLNQGVLYVGGSFTQIDGSDRPRLAAIDASTGALIDWAPAIDDGEVRALALGPPEHVGDPVETLYAGGTFRTIAGVSHRKVAQIGLTTGTTTADPWDPAYLTGNVNAVVANQRYVYVGGEMVASVGGDVRSPTLREIERTPDAHATDWVPDPRMAKGTAGIVYSLQLKPGTLGGLDTMYVGGTFDRIGVPLNPSDPQPTRLRAAEVNLADNGSVTGWDPALTRSDGRIGSVRDFVPLYCTDDGENPHASPACTTIMAGPFESVGGASRPWLAETDRQTGVANDWSPAPDAVALTATCWPLVQRCDIAGNRILAVGGQFTTIGDVPRQALAFFRAP
jgi:arylsulfatase A-like enzyme